MAKKLSTDSVSVGGIPKTLQPGNVVCTIKSITLEPFKFKENSYHIILDLIGPDMGKDFDGFFINKDDESLGKYKGQVGQVKGEYWAFSDGETKTGIPINRDEQIMKFIKGLCTELGISTTVEGDTIEELVNNFNLGKSFQNIPISFCIAGKEYTNKGGYTAYELYLPKFTRKGAPFGKKVVKFNEEDHIIKKKVEAVDEFKTEDDGVPPTEFVMPEID